MGRAHRLGTHPLQSDEDTGAGGSHGYDLKGQAQLQPFFGAGQDPNCTLSKAQLWGWMASSQYTRLTLINRHTDPGSALSSKRGPAQCWVRYDLKKALGTSPVL